MILNSFSVMVFRCVIMWISGMIMGSFLNCCAIRWVHGESVIRGRSHCMACGHSLNFWDLIPLFSWICLKGRCRYCGEKISPGYLMAEIISGMVFLSLFIRFGFSLKLAEMILMTMVLLLVSFTDLEGFIIPDWCILIGILIRLVFVFLGEDVFQTLGRSLIGGVSIALPVLLVVFMMERITGKEMMGGGDLKLLFMVGLYFSPAINLFSFLCACLMGIVLGLLYDKISKREDKHFPFGPAIGAGVWFGVLFGQRMIDLYILEITKFSL